MGNVHVGMRTRNHHSSPRSKLAPFQGFGKSISSLRVRWDKHGLNSTESVFLAYVMHGVIKVLVSRRHAWVLTNRYSSRVVHSKIKLLSKDQHASQVVGS